MPLSVPPRVWLDPCSRATAHTRISLTPARTSPQPHAPSKAAGAASLLPVTLPAPVARQGSIIFAWEPRQARAQARGALGRHHVRLSRQGMEAAHLQSTAEVPGRRGKTACGVQATTSPLSVRHAATAAARTRAGLAPAPTPAKHDFILPALRGATCVLAPRKNDMVQY